MSNELTNPSNDPQLPAFMQEPEAIGTENLDQYVRPPRLKVVQAMSKEPFDQFDKGTVLTVPSMLVFAPIERGAKKGSPFKFVPVFFYAEWIQTNPMSKQPFVRERSLDPKSELARKARNRETWLEPHPEDPSLVVTNREIMNFVIMPYGDHQLAGTLCVLSFSKASFRDGTTFAAMIKLRKASIFGQVFEACSAERSNEKGTWFSFDIQVPEEGKWVTEEEYEVYKQLHMELRKTHNDGLLEVDYEDSPDDAATVDVDATEF